MSSLKGASFKDRQSASELARKALLEKFQARPKSDDPVVLELEAKRKEIAEARALRNQQREREKAERLAKEKAEAEVRAKIDAETREKARLEQEAAAASHGAAKILISIMRLSCCDIEEINDHDEIFPCPSR